MMVTGSLASRLRSRASATEREVIDAAILAAEARSVPLYVVGGAVRDLLVDRPSHDIDFVCEGDAVSLGEAIAQDLAARLQRHGRFGTATLHHGGLHFDLATARREAYAQPAALPTVSAGTLEEDLARRDFTVNAMAIRLWPAAHDDLVDPFAGRQDLEAGVLEILHPRSFLDDPTRALRAVRLEAKSNLRLSPSAVGRVDEAIREGAFERLSGDRLCAELEALVSEAPDPSAVALRLEELLLLRVLGPRLQLRATTTAWLARLGAVSSPLFSDDAATASKARWMAVLRVLVSGLDRSDRSLVARRLALEGAAREHVVDGLERLAGVARQLAAADLPPHRVDELLRDLHAEELLLLAAAKRPTVRRWVERWWLDMRPIQLTITGDDLVERGFPPGPQIGQALAATRRARLDGRIDAEGELGFALDDMDSLRLPGDNGA